jgi:hypothetical protein
MDLIVTFVEKDFNEDTLCKDPDDLTIIYRR